MPDLRLQPPLADVLDIALVSVLLYALIVWVRGARAHFALLGIAILGCVYLVARQLGLSLTATIFQAFVAVFVVMLIVVFQAELRHAFERIAVLGLRWTRNGSLPGARDPKETLVRSAAGLVAAGRGGLIVLPGRDPIDRHVEGGITLGGRLSEPILLSIFDPHSPGHDGAVILEGDQIARFAVHLPLSSDFAQLGGHGTRHAAALGLAERTDALCVVISEERGTVSVAHLGTLRELRQPAELSLALRDFTAAQAGQETVRRRPRALVCERWRELSASLVLAVLLWVLVVPGSEIAETVVRVPIVIENLPPDWTIERIAPTEVDATVAGLRRDLFFVDASRFSVNLDAELAQFGRRTFELSPDDVRHPPELEVRAIDPLKVRLDLRKEDAAEAPAAPSG
ncbi:MAG: diadenylate cyclase [Myxococcota bacterium]